MLSLPHGQEREMGRDGERWGDGDEWKLNYSTGLNSTKIIFKVILMHY